MIGRIKLVDVELGGRPEPLGDLGGYHTLRALVRIHGIPFGQVEVALADTGIQAADLRRIVLRRLEWPIIRHHLDDVLESPLPPEGLDIEGMLDAPHPVPEEGLPLITVAVCTRDRTEDLKTCLDSLLSMDYPHLDILIIDNAPASDATERLVKESYPQVRHVVESKPGLDWARNRAIAEARGEIVAFTDDDVVADPGWASGLSRAFGDPEVMGVTGLIVPHELETEAQVLFERYGGFGRGYRRMHWRMDPRGGEGPRWYLNAGRYGTGANMAYRREVFGRIGLFDPALDVGTVTNGGGDLEMFFRVLKEGYLLAYEPSALVRHRHRREYAQLRKQLTDNGIGFASYLVRTAQAYPELREEVVRFWLWWFRRWILRRLVMSYIRPWGFPRDLILAELWGFVKGLGRYPRSRRQAEILSKRASPLQPW